jgi:ankyrin repeat protein
MVMNLHDYWDYYMSREGLGAESDLVVDRPEPASAEDEHALVSRVAERAARLRKIKLSRNKILSKTEKDLAAPLDIDKQSSDNLRKLIASLKAGSPHMTVGACYGRGLPEGFPTDIAVHANHIMERHYLQPFDPSKSIPPDEVRLQPELERLTHGAMHACRVAAWVKVFVQIYRYYEDFDALCLNDEDILLIQIAALFHDSARQSDGVDVWDSQSAELCYRYLIEHGIDEERACFFSNAACHKDVAGIKTIAHRLIHDADAADIVRVIKEFRIEELDLYQSVREYCPSQLATCEQHLVAVMYEIRGLIARQSDLECHGLPEGAAITCHDRVMLPPIEPTFDEERKKRYEHAENCYTLLTSELERFVLLNSLYHSPAPAMPVSADRPLEPHPSVTGALVYRFGLDAEEHRLLHCFLGMDFVLHHTTSKEVMQSILAKNPAALRDPSERKRWGDATIHSATPDFCGIGDNVFWGLSIGAASLSPPRFTHEDTAVTVILRIRELQQKNPGALSGLWSSGHFLDYQMAKTHHRIKNRENPVIGGTECARQYTHRYNPDQGSQYTEERLYQNTHGLWYVRRRLEEEIFSGDHVFLALGLMMLEQLRLLGKDNSVRQYLLKNPTDADTMSKVMANLFPICFYELKLPGGVNLRQPGVTLMYTDAVPDEVARDPRIHAVSRRTIADLIVAAAQTGNVAALEEYKKMGYPLEGDLFTLVNSTEPLEEAIACQQTITIEWMIKAGVRMKCFKHAAISAHVYRGNSDTNIHTFRLTCAARKAEILDILKYYGLKDVVYDSHLIFWAYECEKDFLQPNELQLVQENCPGFNINMRNPYGQTLLIVAIHGGYLKSAQALLRGGADPFLRVTGEDCDPGAALHYAAQYMPDPAFLLELIDTHHMDPNMTDGSGWTPFHAAISGGNKAAIILLRERGGTIDNTPYGPEEITLLLHAAIKGHTDIVLYLTTECGLSPHIQDVYGNIALHYLAEHGKLDEALLIACGGAASINIENHAGETPLTFAVLAGKIEAVRFLLAHGATYEEALPPIAEVSDPKQQAIRDLLMAHQDMKARTSQAAAPDTTLTAPQGDGIRGGQTKQ